MNKFVAICLALFLLTGLLAGWMASPPQAAAALGIISVEPATVSNTVTSLLTIRGTDFVQGAVVFLGGYGALNTTFVDSATLTAALPAGAPPGVYTLTVSNPDATSASLANALTVVGGAQSTPTPTTSSPGTYERPVVVVQSYEISQETISMGQSFQLYVTVYNAGQKTALNTVATFTPGDLVPTGTGGVIAVGNIAPDNRADLTQPLTVSSDLWGVSIASILMTLSYSDEVGVLYTESFVITLPLFHPYVAAASTTPTPTATPTVTPPPMERPQLVIISYSADLDPLQPGATFQLTLSVQNVGNADARRVTMIVGGGEAGSADQNGTPQAGGVSGASGEFSNFAPVGASNVQSLGDLEKNETLEAIQSLIVNTSTTPGAYPIKISFSYVDASNRSFTDDQVITLLVYQVPTVDIDFYRDPNPIFAGQPNSLPLQVVNLGRTGFVLGNMTVGGQGAQYQNNVILIGYLDTGGYFPLDAIVIPDQPGPLDLLVTIDYTDDFNQQQIISETLTVEVQEMEFIGPEGEIPGGEEPLPPAQPETLWQKVLRFIKGFLGLDSAPPTSGMEGELPPSEEFPVEGEQPIKVP